MKGSVLHRTVNTERCSKHLGMGAEEVGRTRMEVTAWRFSRWTSACD